MPKLPESSELDAQRIVKVLDHPARKRIIELLGSKGPLPWKELSTEVGMGTGALYYHLDALDGIVQRAEDKRYTLTKTGKIVFSYLQTNTSPASVQNLPAELMKFGWRRRLAEGIFAPRSFLHRLTFTASRSLLSLAVISAALLVLLGSAREGVRLFFVSPVSSLPLVFAYYFGSLLLLAVVSYLFTLAVFRSRSNPLSLLVASAFSLAPVTLFSTALLAAYSFLGVPFDRNLYTLLLVFFQGWSASLLGAGISVASGVRVEKTILASLVALYATMVIIFMQGAAG